MRAERFLHSQLMCIVDYFLYTTRACCCVGRHRESHSPFCQLVSLKLRIWPLLSGIVLSYYSHSPKSFSVKHGDERRMTARAEKFRILQTENHICNAQRTHSKTGSTLRLIYHSRILRLRTGFCFWLGGRNYLKWQFSFISPFTTIAAPPTILVGLLLLKQLTNHE